jgi:hypothetical protein
MRGAQERSFKNYFAGAAISFGIVLIAMQIIALYFAGMSEEQAMSLYYLRFALLSAVNFLGGAVGSFLVARRVGGNYLQVGIITAICSYILESIYFILFGEGSSDMLVIVSLVLGGVIGSLFAKADADKRLAAFKASEVQMQNEPHDAEG